MPMSLAQMVKEVEAAHVAYKLMLDIRKRSDCDRVVEKLLLEPQLVEHFSLMAHVCGVACRVARMAGVDLEDISDQYGLGKFVEWSIERMLPPKKRERAWLSVAGWIAAYDPARDPYLRAALGANWKQSLLEQLPAAVRLAFNESRLGEKLASDGPGKRSITSRTTHLLRKMGDEAAEKPKRVTSKRLEPGETELALFAQQEAQGTSLAAEEDFFAYMSALKPHQGETRRVVVDTANITVTRRLDEVKTRIPFTKREARVFDLLRETSDRHEIARRLGVKPESVTRIKTRIKEKTEAHLPIIVS